MTSVPDTERVADNTRSRLSAGEYPWTNPASGNDTGWFGNFSSPPSREQPDGPNLEDEITGPSTEEMAPSRSGNGQNALASIYGSSLRIPNRSTKSISLLLNATSVRYTDPGIFTLYRQEIASADGICDRWYKDASFRSAADKYVEQLKNATGYALRTELEGFLAYLINQKDASIELAVQTLVFFGTKSIRARATTAAFQADPRAAQIMEFCESYFLIPHDKLPWFEHQAVEQGDFDLSIFNLPGQPSISTSLDAIDLSAIPGHIRLTVPDADIRAQTWTHFVVHLIHTLCGRMKKNSIDIPEHRAMLFIPSKSTEPHPLRQLILANGELQPVTIILKAEASVARHLEQVELILGTGQLQITTLTRIKNLLFRGFHPDIKAAIMEIFRMSDHHYELIDDCPYMPMEAFRAMAIAAGGMVAKDTERLKIRRDTLKSAKKESTADPSKDTNNSKQSGSTQKCSICHKTDHAVKTCPKRTGQECTFFARFGHCKFGDKCRNDHKQKPAPPPHADSGLPPPKEPAAASTATEAKDTTTTPASQEEEVVKIECSQMLEGCTGIFEESKPKWDKLLEAHPDWVMPKGCPNCRALKKLQSSVAWRSPDAGLVTTEDPDSDEEDVDDTTLMSYYTSMMTVEDDFLDSSVNSDTTSSSEELSDLQLHEQLLFQARRAAATNNTVSALSREAIELRQDSLQPLHPKRVSVTTHTYARQYAQDIMEIQSRAILDDSFEMQGAYYDSDVNDASMDLSSLSISPVRIQGQARDQATKPLITDFFSVQPTSLEFEPGYTLTGKSLIENIDASPASMTQQSLRDAARGYAFVASLPAPVTHFYPEDTIPLSCSVSPVAANYNSPEDSDDDTPISELFAQQETPDFR
jgi:hypothetical protein